jgi:hypothetical protein
MNKRYICKQYINMDIEVTLIFLLQASNSYLRVILCFIQFKVQSNSVHAVISKSPVLKHHFFLVLS